MRVDYGPPGLRGVTTILGLGDADATAAAEADRLAKTTRKAAAVLAATAFFSWLVGAKRIANTAGAGAGTLIAVLVLARKGA